VSALRSLRQAVAFLTPVGGAAVPTPGALGWFGIVGALIGGTVGISWWAAAQWLPLLVAAAFAVLIDLAVTGLLHIDGLSDSADGLLAPMAPDRRLAVMSDPRAGAFGVAAVTATLLVRFSIFASLDPRPRTILAIAALWSVSRAAMAVAAVTVPYARSVGLASAFLMPGPPRLTPRTVLGLVALGTPAAALGLIGTVPAVHGLLAVVAAALGAAVVITFAQGRIGGFTGDVLGAAGVVAETVGLLLLSVRP
jgi:adenosylcobinamide-GDP ribazoletransferase